MVSQPGGPNLDGTSHGLSTPHTIAPLQCEGLRGRVIRGPHAFDIGASEPDLPTEEELLLSDAFFAPSSWEMSAAREKQTEISAGEYSEKLTEVQMEHRSRNTKVPDGVVMREKRKADSVECGEPMMPGWSKTARDEYSRKGKAPARPTLTTEHTGSDIPDQKLGYLEPLGSARPQKDNSHRHARHDTGTNRRRMPSPAEEEQSEGIGGKVSQKLFRPMADSTIDGWQLVGDPRLGLQQTEVLEPLPIAPLPCGSFPSTASSISTAGVQQPQLALDTVHDGSSCNRGSLQPRLNTAESIVIKDDERLARILPSVQNGHREPKMGISARVGQTVFLVAARTLWLPKRH